MKESGLWATMGPNVKKYGLFDRIESWIAAGIPDVTFNVKGIDGWIELKHEKKVPVKPNTIMRFKISDEQRLWWIRRRFAGTPVFVFIQITYVDSDKDCWYGLFDAHDAAKHLGVDWTVKQMKEGALAAWDYRCEWKELCKILILPMKKILD